MIEDFPIFVKEENSSRSKYLDDFVPLVSCSNTEVARPIPIVEKVLISKFKVGDSIAFSDIFTAYYKDLVMFAARFFNNLNDAEEIVQDTFVKLWEDREIIDINVSLRSYLLKTIQNKCIDWYRHKRIIQDHYDYITETSIKYVRDAEGYILHSELQQQIEKALNSLPNEVSHVFRMNRYEGLKYNEISRILGISVRTVEVRIGRALKLLRILLREYLVLVIGLVFTMMTGHSI
jgi:RNA polymerase sigma-70 factor (family 1)